MFSAIVTRRIRLIQIKARKLLSGNLIGDYSTPLKGTGFEFDQVREYYPEDDVRFIDWKSSARTNKLLTKQYHDERNRSVVILLDVSNSSEFGVKQKLMTEVAAIFAAMADYGKDSLGLLLFAGDVLKFVPLGRGPQHLAQIMSAIFDFQKPTDKSILAQTRLDLALKYAMRQLRDQSLLFVISDFVSENDFSKELRVAANRHDVIAVRCLDAQENELPACGLLQVSDPETGQIWELDQHSRREINQKLRDRKLEQADFLQQIGVDLLDLQESVDQFLVAALKLFKRRMFY